MLCAEFDEHFLTTFKVTVKKLLAYFLWHRVETYPFLILYPIPSSSLTYAGIDCCLTDKFGHYLPVQRLALAVPKLGHIPHAESLATSLLQVILAVSTCGISRAK